VPTSRRKLFLASSNPGKLRELTLAWKHAFETRKRPAKRRRSPKPRIEMCLLPRFDRLPAFKEAYSSFALNASGKALHYSRFSREMVLADDSGLVVNALGGAPGISSARYAGPNASDADRIQRLLGQMKDVPENQRGARFVCALALAQKGRLIAFFSDYVEGRILTAPRGSGGFGYDPVFFFEPFQKTFAEISRKEKNLVSHRGKALHKLVEFLITAE
jgi:XTP/dITP diphosphohydrolase